jgi:hypothetical protein
VLERVERDMGAELDRPRNLHDDVDMFGAREQHGVVGRGGLAGPDRFIERGLRMREDDVLKPGVLEHLHRPLRMAVGDGDDPHSRRRVRDLVDETLGHEAGADDADADWPSLGFALLKSGVD